ncbi:major facilitator superfamily transporter [Xylariaceae sp. AK1471]|nr:major facilitator superfamily transporter [Xylariaceae sp. AK1471]
MAFRESLSRTSFWLHDNHDIALHRLSELSTEYDNIEDGTMLPAQNPRSRFSDDSGDDDDETLFVTTICLAHLCAQAGVGQTLPVLKAIGARFKVANVNNLSWAVAGYAAALGTFILISGRLGEIFGHKRMFILGLVWSAAWSIVVGASFYSTQKLFIIGRALQGLGAALTLPTSLALLGATRLTGSRKTIIFTLYAMMSPIGFIVGALSASILTLAWWSWTYWVFSLVLIGLATIGYFIIPSAPQEVSMPSRAHEFISELDIPGMVAGIASLGLFGFAWNQAQTVGWQQSYLWMSLIMSVILAALFVLIEAYYAPRPLIPSSALSSEMSWILVALGCGCSCFGIWIFYGWQFVEILRHASPLLSTAYFVPMMIIGCLAVVSTGFVFHRVGLPTIFCISLLTMTVGGILIATMPIRQTYWQLFISILFMAWGLYTSVPAATLMILNAVDKQHHSVATSLISTVTYYGMALGLGVAGTVESNIMSTRLTVLNRLRGYRAAHWTSVGLAGIGFVICLALAWRKRQLCYALQPRYMYDVRVFCPSTPLNAPRFESTAGA